MVLDLFVNLELKKILINSFNIEEVVLIDPFQLYLFICMFVSCGFRR